MTEEESRELHEYLKRKFEADTKKFDNALDTFRRIEKANRPKQICSMCNKLWDIDERCSCGFDPIEYLEKFFSHS